MARADWYRLDNVGKFYAAEAGRTAQTVFRFSAAMADEVDPLALQRALDGAVDRFPSFNVCLRSGLFWHYLEPSRQRPEARPETLPVCASLHAGPGSVLFRVTWHDRRINLEVSHMISDGRGSYRFFQALIGLYAHERYGAPVPPPAEDTAAQQAEDSFARYYRKSEAHSTPAARAYQLKGPRQAADPAFLEYHLSAEAVHGWARSMGVSVTSLVIAALICAIRAEMAPRERQRPIRLNVPVDLRQFFDSSTLRNFFGLAFVSYVPGPEDEPLEAVAAEVQRQVLASCTAEAIKGRMMRMVSLERNPFLRLAPLFAKDLVLGLAARIAARDVTTTASSLGRVQLPEGAEPYVRSVTVLTSTSGLNLVLCTFGDDLCIGLSTAYVGLSLVRRLCRLFSEEGLFGSVNLNQDADDVARRLREMRLEETLRRMADVRQERSSHAHVR